METIIITSKKDLKEILEETLNKVASENRKKRSPKLFTVNQVAKRLGKAHSTIKGLISKGYLKTTKDGLIPESSIEEYLKVS